MGTEEDRNVFAPPMPDGWHTYISLTEAGGWYHVWCRAEWPSAEICEAQIGRVLHGFADGRVAFIRRKPEVVTDKDFDTQRTRHRGSVRFSFKTEAGEWTYPPPDDGSFVGFGLAKVTSDG